MGLNYQSCIIVEYIFKPFVCKASGTDDVMYLCVYIQLTRKSWMTSLCSFVELQKSSVTQSDHAEQIWDTHLVQRF